MSFERVTKDEAIREVKPLWTRLEILRYLVADTDRDSVRKRFDKLTVIEGRYRERYTWELKSPFKKLDDRGGVGALTPGEIEEVTRLYQAGELSTITPKEAVTLLAKDKTPRDSGPLDLVEVIKADPFFKSSNSQVRRNPGEFVCRYGIPQMFVEDMEETVYLQGECSERSLYVVGDAGHGEAIVARPFDKDMNEEDLAAALLQIFFELRAGHIWPGQFIRGRTLGEKRFRQVVKAASAALERRKRRADPEVLKNLRDKGHTEIEPTAQDGIFRVRCPNGPGHCMQVNIPQRLYYCGYCRVGGKIEDLTGKE